MSTLDPAVGLGSDHAHDHGHHDIGFVKKYLFSTYHKMIGMQFLITTLLMLLVGLLWLVLWLHVRKADSAARHLLGGH